MTGWPDPRPGGDFPLANLPYGIFSNDDGVRAGVAVGNSILDLAAVQREGHLACVGLPDGVFAEESLNRFLGLGRDLWSPTRRRVRSLLEDPTSPLRREPARWFVNMDRVAMHLPIDVADYVDFYSSLHHATNMGRMLRPESDPLLPNWRHLPVGYHGRASSVVVSGTEVVRPAGQRRGRGDLPEFGPSQRLDIELEVGFVTGPGNRQGVPISADDAEQHIFGMCLVNDWSARDIQAWEYQPLGPFLGKSFATTMSPWLVSLEALEPFRTAPPPQFPEPPEYLKTTGRTGLDLQLEVQLNETVVARTSFADMYWTMAQQLAHTTVNGANIRPGDLYASGTVSGADPGSYGSLVELTENGTNPITLEDGTERTFLEDGDTVTIRGWCGSGSERIGLGECRGTVAARQPP